MTAGASSGACFVMALFAWGIGFYGHSVYLAEFTLGRGWSSAAVSGATTVYYPRLGGDGRLCR